MERDDMEPVKRLEQKDVNLAGGFVALSGVVVALSSVGLWQNSGTLSGSDEITIRIGLTCFMIAFGFLLVRIGRRDGDEFAIDYKTGKLFHLQRGRNGRARLRRSFDLSDLDVLGFENDVLVARERDGEEILRVAVSGPVPQAAIDRIASGNHSAASL